MSAISQLTHLAYQFGPFAFCLIFLFYLAKWGHKIWSDAVARAPATGSAEKIVNGAVFIAMVVAGLALTGLSVQWWWNHRPIYWYESQISSLSETEVIEGDRIFVRNNYLRTSPGAPQYRDAHLLIFQNRPFVEGQKLSFKYTKDNTVAHQLDLEVKLDEKTEYAMEFAASKWKLKRLGATAALIDASATRGSRLAFDLMPSAYAQSAAGGASRSIEPSKPPLGIFRLSDEVRAYHTLENLKFKPAALVTSLEQVVEVLQSPHAQVSAKASALTELSKASVSERGDLFNIEIAKPTKLVEPAFVTLSDLTRHTDQEIAAKARDILVRTPLPVRHFADLLSSKDAAQRGLAVKEYLRLEPQYADLLSKELIVHKVDVTLLGQVSISGSQWRLLVPTATTGGDKFFMKASWDSKQKGAANCLPDSVVRDLGIATSAKSEMQEGQARTTRIFGDADKAKILSIAAAVQNCGGNPEFVGFYPFAIK